MLDQALERALKRDRMIVLFALAAVMVLCWAYILAGAGMGMSAFEMTRMSAAPAPMDSATADGSTVGLSGAGVGAMQAMAMMTPAVWTLNYAVLMFFMWWIMMIAMMLPSATPMILLFAALNRKQREAGNPYVSTGVFAIAYLVIWAGFSGLAVGLQWLLEHQALLSPMLVANNPLLGGLLLTAAGLYQLTPVKHACLKHCRTPLQFLSSRWRGGGKGALRMGLEHGLFCVACCWFLMGLLFFGGVMNLYWIAGLAVFVLLEKTIPAGHWLGTAIGFVLLAWGGWLLIGAL